MGIVVAPKSNLQWKLDKRVQEGYTALLKSKDKDLIEYMKFF